MYRVHSEKGQSLMELVVVIAVIVIVIGALVFATIASLRNSTFAKNQAQATKLAQEGIETVRTGRDRNSPIINISGVDSWSGPEPFWTYHISGVCDRPDLQPPGNCYFNIDSTGQLTNIGIASPVFPQLAEGIPKVNPVFQRAILLSDDLDHNKKFDDDDYTNQKEVTAIVSWTDFSGSHESKIITILGKTNK